MLCMWKISLAHVWIISTMIIDKYWTFSLNFSNHIILILNFYIGIFIRNNPVAAKLSFCIVVSKEKFVVTSSIWIVASDNKYDPIYWAIRFTGVKGKAILCRNIKGHFCRSEMNSAKSILPNFPVERFFCLH